MSDDVLLHDLIAVTGGTEGRARALLDQLGAEVREDALGRLVVGAAEARAARELEEREQRELLEDQALFHRWAAEREEESRRTWRVTFDRELARGVRGQHAIRDKINSGEIDSHYADVGGAMPIDQATRSSARQAAHEARTKYDRAHPQLGYWEWRESKAAQAYRKKVAR